MVSLKASNIALNITLKMILPSIYNWTSCDSSYRNDDGVMGERLGIGWLPQGHYTGEPQFMNEYYKVR